MVYRDRVDPPGDPGPLTLADLARMTLTLDDINNCLGIPPQPRCNSAK